VSKTSTADSILSRAGVNPHLTTAPDGHPTQRLLGLAVAAAVFGIPFIYCLQGAARGHLFLGRYSFFGHDSLMSGLAAWAVATALGSLWLGVSLQLDLAPRLPERIKNAVVVGLIFASVALVLFSARLLSLRAAS